MAPVGNMISDAIEKQALKQQSIECRKCERGVTKPLSGNDRFRSPQPAT